MEPLTYNPASKRRDRNHPILSSYPVPAEKSLGKVYNAALAITGAIVGSSHEKIFKESGLEYLKSRRWLVLCLQDQDK